ncbi:unnamed protein product [Timema podura]|uniref:Ionotropic glutamate receptor C-terminal domain-containing protein n=1 Tax=Timema podura TaxID=61482 RepID=A0ABN7NBQ1_TIMPD|nr:unnamed protein product [Timema podura]
MRRADKKQQKLIQLQRVLSEKGVATVAVKLLNLSEGTRELCPYSAGLAVVTTKGNNTKKDLTQISAQKGLVGTTWLMFLQSEDLDNFLDEVDVPFNCRFLVAKRREGARVEVTQVYRVIQNHPLVQHNYILSEAMPEFPGHDLKGVILRAAFVNCTFIWKTINANNDVQMEGFMGKVWTYLEALMNFTTVYYATPDSAWGSKEESGDWNGMIGHLTRGEADVAPNLFMMTKERNEVVDFTHPFMLTKYYVHIHRPHSVWVSWNSFLSPLHDHLWWTIVAALMVLSTCLYYCEPNFNISSSIFCILSTYTHQDFNPIPSTLRGRGILLASHVVSMVVIAAYSATLISLLAVQHNQAPFNTFSQLLQLRSYQFGVTAMSGEYDMFSKSNQPVIKTIHQMLMVPDKLNFPPNELEGLNRVCSHKYAYMTSDVAMWYVISQAKCSVMSIAIDMYRVPATMALQRSSPYSHLINHYVERLRSSGVTAKLIRSESFPNEAHEETPILEAELSDIAGVFAVLITGTILAVILLASECILSFKQIHRRLIHIPFEFK